MPCLSHPEASTETCRPCGVTYCTGTGCGHDCPPSGSIQGRAGEERMACSSHPDSGMGQCAPCGAWYCKGCGHSCPKAEEGEAFRVWLEGADRVGVRLAGISLGVAISKEERVPELHLTVALPCPCPHESCSQMEPLILHFPWEDAEQLQRELSAFMSDPDVLLKIMCSMDPSADQR